MQTVFKWIDQFFHSMPDKVARSIRLGFIGVWILVAGVVSYRACVVGQSEAPQDGQDLQLSRIKEQIIRDENRNNAPEIQLPDPDQILPENSAIDNLPLPEPGKDVSTLPGSADLKERDPNPSSETLPPFLGESDQIIFPRRDGQDPGSHDSRERNNSDSRPSMLSEPDSSRDRIQSPESSNDSGSRPAGDGSGSNTESGNRKDNMQEFQLIPEKQ
ncbi:MAG: hypothetical protein CMN77_18250 [Spirochaetaceae bacterium]|nr:hypothetical protein [Spirochaetaceae bacterium]